MTFPARRILLFHSSKPSTMSRTGGKPTVRKMMRGNHLCSWSYPLGILSDTPSRNNIIFWGAMRTSAYNGLRCGSKGIKMCMSWQIYSIPCAQSWVSKIQRKNWCWITVVVCIDIFKRKWSSSTSPLLVHHIGMLPRLSRNSNRIRKNLDLRIKIKGKVPSNPPKNDKSKAWRPNTACHSSKKIKTTWI